MSLICVSLSKMQQSSATSFCIAMSDISVYVTSDVTSSERRISPQWDLHHLKTRLEQITGIAPKFQTIQYYPLPSSNQYEIISDASSYSEDKDRNTALVLFKITPFARLHIIDANPDSELADFNNVDENDDVGFKLSEEDYQKRSDSVLRWKQTQKLGKYDPEYNLAKQRAIEEEAKISTSIRTGDRCRVINIQGERRGTVRFVGKIKMLDDDENTWVGVEFDEPVGRNDGLIDGVQIFSAKPKHGSFVKPKQVEVGDFPELDPFASDDDDEL